MAKKKMSREQTRTQFLKALMLNFYQLCKRSKLARFLIMLLLIYQVLLGDFINTLLTNETYLEVFPREIIFPSVMHFVTALIISLIVLAARYPQRYYAKVISGVALALFMLDYDTNLSVIAPIIRVLTPTISNSDSLVVVSLFYLLVISAVSLTIGWLAQLLIHKTKRVSISEVEVVIVVWIAVFFIWPAITMTGKVPLMLRQSHAVPGPIESQGDNGALKDMPDIYYLVFDRYTNALVLKDQFGYDNSKFVNSLQTKGFAVDNNATSNYPYTTLSIASTLNANYTNGYTESFKDDVVHTSLTYNNLIQQSSVVRAAIERGYQYYSIGSTYGVSYRAPLASRHYMHETKITVLGRSKRLWGLEATEFKKSPYFRFFQLSDVSFWPFKVETRSEIDYLKGQLDSLNQITKEEPGGRLIFAHLLSPHPPYYFNADGSLATDIGPNNIGKLVKDKYTDQVTFLNGQIDKLVSNIMESSNNQAVVLLLSDEGPYPQVMNSTVLEPTYFSESSTDYIAKEEDIRTWSDDWLKMKYGILEAVYIPKATKDDLRQMSSVNAFRVVLNRYFGYSLDYLPDCKYGLTSGKWLGFKYADITSRFSDNPPTECALYQTDN